MEEWIDLYDRSGRSLGRKIPKGAKRENGEYYRHVHIILYSRHGGWLIQQRSMGKEFFPGKWDVTGGGVMAGEESRDAALREVREELGLSIPPEELRYAGGMVVEEAGRCLLDVWYALLDFRPEECVLQKEEVQAVKLVSFEELLALCLDKGPEYRALLEKTGGGLY